MKTIPKSRNQNDFHKLLLSDLSAYDYDRLDIELGISRKMVTNLINEPYRLNISQIQVISYMTKKSIDEISIVIGKIPLPEIIKTQKRIPYKRRRVFLSPVSAVNQCDL